MDQYLNLLPYQVNVLPRNKIFVHTINVLFTVKWFLLCSNSIENIVFKSRCIIYFGDPSVFILLLFTLLRQCAMEPIVLIIIIYYYYYPPLFSSGIMYISLLVFSQKFATFITHASIKENIMMHTKCTLQPRNVRADVVSK